MGRVRQGGQYRGTRDHRWQRKRRSWQALVRVLLGAPRDVEAQLARSYRLFFVNSASETEEPKPHVQALRAALRELGYVEGKDLIFEAGFAGGDVGHYRVELLVSLYTANGVDLPKVTRRLSRRR